MADRTVRVVLKAQVDEYIAGMEKAARQTQEAGSEAEKLAQKKDAIQSVGVASMAMGTVVAAGVGLAISKWADFDEAMSQVQAATGEGEESMKALSDAALEAGGRTVFSAEEAANAIEELAKAGVSTADILNGGLDGALDLAAAGGLGVAEAAGIAATALKTFGLEGKDMSHVADLMAAGAGKAMGDVTDLSAALNQSAMVANATGLSIEETTATLAAFASQGLLGSDAGTSFKSMLQSLTPTSAKAKETMAELGISAYDAQGNFIGMAEFAGNLKDGLKDLSVEQQQAALKTIFGSDAIRAATVLYNEGEEGIRDWEDAVNDQGYAAEQAAARLDNLKGDLEALGGALDTALIKTGSGANDALRTMVQLVTGAIDAYSNLPPELQSAALVAGVLVAAITLLGGGFMIATIKVAEFQVALATLGVTSATARASLMGTLRFLTGPWGIALMAASITVGVFSAAMEESKVSAEEMEIALKQGKSGFEAMQEEANKGLNIAWVYDMSSSVENLGSVLQESAGYANSFTRFLFENFDDRAAIDNVQELGRALAQTAASDLPEAISRFQEFGEAAGLNTEEMALALDQMSPFKSALIDVAESSGLATDDATLLKIALGEIGPAAEEGAAGVSEQNTELEALEGNAQATQDAVSDLADEIRGFGSATFDMREANRALEQSYEGLNEKLALNGANFDITTQAGRDTQSALDEVANATNIAAAALLENGASQEEVNAKLAEGKSALIDILAPYLGSRDAAAEYVNQLGLISPEKVTDIIENAAAAKAEVEAYKGSLDGIPGSKDTTVNANVTDAQANIISFMGVLGTIPSAVNIAINANPQGLGPLKLDNADGGMYAYADGGIEAYADGGFTSGIYKGGAPIHKFAEPETIWEAYISGKPDQRDRNRQIWAESGDRLGVFDEIKKFMTQGSGGSGGSGATVTQYNNITQVERDPRLLMRQLGREIKGAL